MERTFRFSAGGRFDLRRHVGDVDQLVGLHRRAFLLIRERRGVKAVRDIVVLSIREIADAFARDDGWS